MQDALLESYPVAAPVDFGSHTLSLQPYHSPAAPHNYNAGTTNTGLLTTSTHPLTSHDHQLFKLESNRYTSLLPNPNIDKESVKSSSAQEGQNCGVDEVAPEAEYVNSRCVIFTFYTGDVNTVVDEHFKRALDQPSSFSRGGLCNDERESSAKTQKNSGNHLEKETSKSTDESSDSVKKQKVSADDSTSTLMCRRNFPPSFWNSNYWQDMKTNSLVPIDTTNLHYLNSTTGNCYFQNAINANNAITPYRASDPLLTAESYNAYRQRTSAIHGHSDPWHYTFSAHHQSAFSHHKSSFGIHELSYGYATGGAFNPRYSSLLIQPTVRSTMLPAVPGQMELPKPSAVADNWNSSAYNGIHTHPQYFSTDLQTTYTIDPTPTVEAHDTVATAKDFLWF